MNKQQQLWYISEFDSHATTMKIINKITGKDVTSDIIRKWEKEYEEKGIKIKKSKRYERKK